MFALHSCIPLQKTGEGFAEHYPALAELVPLSELFPGPFFFFPQKLTTFYQLTQKEYVLKRVWLISHLPLLRAGLESTTLGKRDQSTRT